MSRFKNQPPQSFVAPYLPPDSGFQKVPRPPSPPRCSRMASSLPSSATASDSDHPPSPMAIDSDLIPSHGSSSSSDTSATSDDDSDASTESFPTVIKDVASAGELVLALRTRTPEVLLKFHLVPDSSLADAHELWKIVTTRDGGDAQLINPDRLSSKEEALHCIKYRLERLRRWERHLGRKHNKVLVQVSALDEVIDNGGPGVRPGFEPHRYGGLPAYIDIDQNVDSDDMRGHIQAIRAMFLGGSPANPATDGGEDSTKGCVDREVKEQFDMASFNQDYLQLKATALDLVRNHLAEGIAGLEDRYIHESTHLGAGTAEFANFKEVAMFVGEEPPEGTDFYR